MSATILQPTPQQSRLDVALQGGLVRLGTRFLYTVDGAGQCYEGTLLEISPLGHVRLNDSGLWEWPVELRIEEILGQPAKSVPAPPPAPPPAPAARPGFSVPPTTKPKR